VKVHPTAWAALVALFAAVVGLQLLQAREQPLGLPAGVSTNLLYVRSPEFARRAALSFHALLADIYWIRTVQHYGGTKLSTAANKQYDVLYPLLDLTTSLDPYFDVAYKFGAVFLAEEYPSGAGRPDQATFRLKQLDALDGIDFVERIVQQYRARTGMFPTSWAEMIRAGFLRSVPPDPSGTPFRLDPSTGTVSLDPSSSLNPLPNREHPF
jgi:hypothetical protein